MHKKFDSTHIEKKWQELWKEKGQYAVPERDLNKEKEYILVEWPYPSGNLHIGHWYAFAVPDIYARFQTMNGKQVLFPMGFDAFGLPAENAAIKRGLDPKKWTYDNITYMRTQLESMGNMFAWNKTTSSTDPEYYKWTQWMFTEMYKKGTAYRGKGVVNWCPGCNTVIANEQVLPNGTCERSGDVIVKREMPQWMLKITDYADRLIDDLETVNWPEHIKEAQRQWIGRSKGAEITFQINPPRTSDVLGEEMGGVGVTVFTTRPDTLYGATYIVLAPEHPLIQSPAIRDRITNLTDVDAYIANAKQKDEQDRLDNTKEKTGVRLIGITATNPATGEEIPVYIADYVLGNYGTGAIMAVPAHDERDFEFAKKFDLPVKFVVSGVYTETNEPPTINRTGVYALIKNEKNEYLIQHYENKDFYWLAGGGIEEGETEIECLNREVLEETGYTDFEIVRKVTEIIYDYQSYRNNQGQIGRNKTVIYEVKLLSTANQGVKFTTDETNDGLVLKWLTKDKIKTLTPKLQAVRIPLILEAIESFEGTKYTGDGVLINSEEFDGMDSEVAKEKIVEKVGGKMTSTYRLRDWSIGRQRYWGVPIPIVYSPQGEAHIVPKEHLPWLLPEDVDPTPTGVAPLAKSELLKKRTEEIFGPGWTPEVETMDTFVDSSWYFLRYIDNQNDNELSSLNKQKEWMPIDIYFGGAEHTTMHLLYSRFWQKALFDLGLVTDNEPYRRRVNRGLILGPDGNKMSKSKGNVIDPDEQVRLVGSDTVKMYLAFMGPYEGNNYPWDMGGIAGVRRFLERVYGLIDHIKDNETEEVTRQLHKTILKVTNDVTEFKFNTAISAMMIFVNLCEKSGLTKSTYESFIKILSPFAPHLTEEIWSLLGHDNSVHTTDFPKANTSLAADSVIEIGVQINGKIRGSIKINVDASEEEALQTALEIESIKERIGAEKPNKVIYLPGKILNIIIN